MKTYAITDQAQIKEIVSRSRVCYLGMIDVDGFPYVIPMNFVFYEGAFYLHSGPEGLKQESLRENPEVCLSMHSGEELVWQHPDVACSYSMRSASVVCRGRAELIDTFDEKHQLLNHFMAFYTDRPFKYSQPAVNNVRIWRVVPRELKCKTFGNSAKK